MSPRSSRFQLATFTYFHVCSKGNNGQELFYDDKDRSHYLELIEKYRKRYNLSCFAYCLMTNHTHLLWLSSSIRALSKTMHGINLAYVMYFNRRHDKNGHLFQDRFSSWVIRDQEHLNYTKDYIENNPVKAGLVKTKEDYFWSSARRDGSFVTLETIMN